MSPVHHLRLCAALCGLLGCGEFPQGTENFPPVAQNADYPALVPLASILAQADGSQNQTIQAATSQLEQRIQNLQRRAANLRSPVIDAPTRARMQQATLR
jgi:hypothetical protein